MGFGCPIHRNPQAYPLAFCIAICQYVVMVCIYCNSKTKTINSRHKVRLNQTWRRRECLSCRAVITSLESADLGSSVRVKSSVSALQGLSRDRLFVDVFRSLSHRKSALSDASGLTDTILSQLVAESSNGIVTTSEIINKTTETLRRFDNVAATVYSAHHPK